MNLNPFENHITNIIVVGLAVVISVIFLLHFRF